MPGLIRGPAGTAAVAGPAGGLPGDARDPVAQPRGLADPVP